MTARKDPARYVQHLLPAKSQVRCYSWKEMYIDNKLMLTGYAKCPPDCATQLLKKAGDRGIFVEPLSCDNSDRKPVEWIPRLPEEEPPAYFRRVLTMCKAKNLPMACRRGSGSCLGLRGGDTSEQQASKWTLRGIPRSWTPEMIETWLKDQKFTNVKHVQPPRTAGGLWTFVAKPDQKPNDAESALIYQTGDTVVTVRPWTKKNPICYESWSSRGSRWIAGETPPEVQENTGGDTKSPDKKKQKTESHSTTNQGAKRLFDDIAGPRGTAIWDLGGHGDCGYRAIAAAAVASRSGKTEAEILENLPALAKTIRSKGHQWLMQNRDWRQSWALDTSANHVTEAGPLPTTPDQYLDALQRPNRWLDGLVAQALATALQTDFLIFEKRQGKWKMSARIQADNSKLHDPIILLLSDDHYRTIRDHASIPKEWKSSTPKGPFQRAAGKSTASEKSFNSWLKPAAVVAKSKPGSSTDKSKSPSQLDASWFKPAKSVRSHASAKSQSSNHADPSDGVATEGIPETHEWTCPLCNILITAKGPLSTLAYKKNNHLKYRHPKADRKQIPKLRPDAAPVCSVSYDMPQHAIAWKCPWCPAQLPSLDSNALNAAVWKHLKQCHKGKTPKQAYKARWRKKCPLLMAAAKRGGAKGAATYAKRRDMQVNGHEIVAISVKWEQWPRRNGSKRKATSKTFREQDKALTCTKCWACGTMSAFNQHKCKNAKPKFFHAAKRNWWNILLKKGSHNPAALAQAWNSTVAEVTEVSKLRRRDVL